MNRIFLLLLEQGRELFARYGVWTWILPFENKDVASWSSSVNVTIKIRFKTKKYFLLVASRWKLLQDLAWCPLFSPSTSRKNKRESDGTACMIFMRSA